MKTKLFFCLIAVGAFLMFSCNDSSSDGVKIDEEKTSSTLYVMGTYSGTSIVEIPEVEKPDPGDPYENVVTPPYEETETSDPKLVFTGEDIVSFNVTTGEMLFVKAKLEEIKKSLGNFAILDFYIDDKPLFVPPIEIFAPVSSIRRDDLQMVIGIDGVILLIEFYQSFDWMSEAERAIRKKQQAETSAKRKKEMEVFIKYLSNAGKIIR